jgi:hydrogenase assembly chaperone HypC/HupF
MCIGVPMRIESGDAFTALAVADDGDGTPQRQAVDMLIVGAQQPGTWVLVFHGAARRVLDPLEAAQMRDALAALRIALETGDDAPQSAIDGLFADLVGREPQLPEALR